LYFCVYKIKYSGDRIAQKYSAHGLDDRGLESRQSLGIFLFTTMSIPALGPTQPPIQWVPGALSLVVNWQGLEADYSPPPRVEVKNV
jgi:hypothetical protein